MLSPPKDGRAPNLTPRCPARTAVSSRSTTEPAARTRPAKLLKEQDKAVADAHISPELVKLVMADVGV